MEAASSAAGIASLGCQIFSGALKIYEFISRMREARGDAQQTAAELVTLARVLDGVDSLEKEHIAALHNCISKVQELDSLVEKMGFGTAKRSRLEQIRISFRHARKTESLRRLKELLAQAKLTLLIAMTQRNLSFGEDLQNKAALDHRLRARQTQALHDHDLETKATLDRQHRSQQSYLETLAHQGASHQSTVLSRLREIDVRLRSCSVSTASQGNSIPNLHWEDLSAEVALMVGKVKDDVLRTNLEHAIHESVKTHFESIVYEQSIDPTLQIAQIAPLSASDIRDGIPLQPVSRIVKAPQVYEHFRHYFFGDIHIVTQTPRATEGEKLYAVQSTFIFHLSSLTILRGLQNRVELQLEGKATQGWKYKLRYFNAVSKNAAIFKVCEEGDIRAVEQLFGSGKASPWDVDEEGWTPLHVAAKYRHRNLCRLLLESSSDSRTLTYPKSCNSVYSPFDLAYFGTLWAKGDESEWIDLIRTFSDTADISFLMSSKDLDLESLALVFDLNEKGPFYDTKALNRVACWVLQNCVRDELGETESRRPVMRHVIQTASESARLADWNYSTMIVQELLGAAGLDVNSTTTTDG